MINKKNFLVEIEQMLEKDDLCLDNIESAKFDQPWLKENTQIEPCIYGHVGSGSGGYSDFIYKFAAEELFGIKVEKLEYKNLRLVKY